MIIEIFGTILAFSLSIIIIYLLFFVFKFDLKSKLLTAVKLTSYIFAVTVLAGLLVRLMGFLAFPLMILSNIINLIIIMKILKCSFWTSLIFLLLWRVILLFFIHLLFFPLLGLLFS